MDLVHDLLDKAVVDRNGRKMGRVDGILLEQRDDGPPRVTALLIGPSVLGGRLHPAIGRWIEALEHAFNVDEGRPVRIPYSKVLSTEPDVKIDVAVGETAAGTIERALREWVGRLPGSK